MTLLFTKTCVSDCSEISFLLPLCKKIATESAPGRPKKFRLISAYTSITLSVTAGTTSSEFILIKLLLYNRQRLGLQQNPEADKAHVIFVAQVIIIGPEIHFGENRNI
jgi:hypothetical protein